MAHLQERPPKDRLPSGREGLLLAVALLGSAWLVSSTEGAAAAAMTFIGLFGLHVVFLLGRARSPASGARDAAATPQIAELQAACAAAEAGNKKKGEFL